MSIRSLFRFALGAWLLGFPLHAFNASNPVPEVNRLPRLALVIGNNSYPDAPLKNAGNDARAISEQLKRMGFAVNVKLDADRQQIVAAIQAFAAELARQKGVGLFYFAGHGAQLAWHNYLIPVDADIEQVSDMQSKAVDVATLLESLARAGNAMNMVILDACRNNPFRRVKLDQAGLSQIDAPVGTLLAYATSPGKVAIDGVGANGLYTENLLKEMGAHGAKIEDVFKRVRLDVRLGSNGLQVPWESTSLEQDFYFIPPPAKNLTPEEIEAQFEEELAGWEKIKDSRDAEPFEDYTRRYPSGRFSELAQFRLDRIFSQRAKAAQLAAAAAPVPAPVIAASAPAAINAKPAVESVPAAAPAPVPTPAPTPVPVASASAVQTPAPAPSAIAEAIASRPIPPVAVVAVARPAIVESATPVPTPAPATSAPRVQIGPAVGPLGPNPFSKGSAQADGNYEIGDSYTYRRIDKFTGLEIREQTETVTDVSDLQIVFNHGRHIIDPLGNDITSRNERVLSPTQFFPAEYLVGKKWVTRYRVRRFDDREDVAEVDMKIVGREKITVPAGTFDAFRLEGRGFIMGSGAPRSFIFWIDPGSVRRPVAWEVVMRNPRGKYRANDRYELVDYRQAR